MIQLCTDPFWRLRSEQSAFIRVHPWPTSAQPNPTTEQTVAPQPRKVKESTPQPTGNPVARPSRRERCSMPIERIREILAGPLTPAYIEQRPAEGWKPVVA